MVDGPHTGGPIRASLLTRVLLVAIEIRVFFVGISISGTGEAAALAEVKSLILFCSHLLFDSFAAFYPVDYILLRMKMLFFS